MLSLLDYLTICLLQDLRAFGTARPDLHDFLEQDVAWRPQIFAPLDGNLLDPGALSHAGPVRIISIETCKGRQL